MPTKKPRIQISLDQASYDVLSELARETNTTMASFVSSVVDASLPGWKGMLEMARRYRTLNEDQLAGFNMAADAFDRITSAMVDAITDEAGRVPNPDDETGRTGRRARRTGRTGSPPSCNTGVRIDD